MTVSYAGEVPNGSSFGCFWKILWKWRGSVYKLVYRELFAYLCLYYIINFSYRFLLSEEQQKIFNKIRSYFAQQGENIPMSFVLGFYVSLVVKRWWEQYRLLPWPDTLALFISAAIPNSTGGVNSETGRLMRRNIMRYMVLAYVITLQRISLRVKRRFPTTQHLVDAGLMHESEMKIFEALNAKSPMSKYWMPLVWATNIINRARKDGLITSDHIVQTILVELSDIRRRLGGLIGYDTVCVPLVYTQVVTLVLYTYFMAALLGKQMLPNVVDHNGKENHDLYFPLFTVLQFLFYVGWLKVAEVLINPFGEDDDDIELNWLIDRHIKAAYMIVDEMHEEHPELLRDQYWECVVPKDLPYTVASEHYRKDEPKGSAEHYKVKKEDAMYANIVPIGGKRAMADDVYADYESVNTPMVERRKNNWLVRQLSRMGSMRSQSTAYSSGGAQYNRNRLNSVYSTPESVLPMSVMQQQQQQHSQHQHMNQGLPGMPNLSSKPSLYEKFLHRKSLRAQKQLIKQNSKLNGLKARPRIPTPDVSKDTGEKSSSPFTFPTPFTSFSAPPASSTVIMTPQMSTTQFNTNISNANPYPYKSTSTPDGQVLGTFLLSPINEMDGSSSNNTLIPGHPATTALAQAILPANVRDVSFGLSTPMSVTTSNMKPLSVPFGVTSSSLDTNLVNTTLNIVPKLSSQVSSITTTAGNNFGENDIITTIPLSLSMQHTPSTVETTEIDGRFDHATERPMRDGTKSTKTTAILSINPLNDGNLRETELCSNSSLIPTDSNVLERNRLKPSAEDTNKVWTNKMKDAISSNVEHMITSGPSSVKRLIPEPKSGEVYV